MGFCLRLACYCFAVLGLLAFGRPAAAEETIKIAYIDPFSGPFASGGDEFLKIFQFIFERKNARAARWAGSSNWCRSTTSCSPPRR